MLLAVSIKREILQVIFAAVVGDIIRFPGSNTFKRSKPSVFLPRII